ncbi:NYN domain protein [Arthrobacter sp. UCD-GKA]|uniref:NYN domain-containing protein n=1 Tax=Arthrobacter sp. UCD-GKA TaxID=1913576 RepID=UPI0008DE7AB9|nr:NYN domain-containing protein [Arthrobacter sp. UCD-GKA]OIH82191.1 NYN domain protein [Arthrobacter sp. UCD-GKA]
MMSQSAIFVDASFLLAIGGHRASGTTLRAAYTVNYEALIEGILKTAKEFSGLENLRIYWYDAAKDAIFTDQHKRIGLIPGVKVRLGRISFNGEQKGVDLKLGLDLVGIARNRAASVAFLVSGDDDLAEAVEEAQDLGMKVVLIGVEKADHRLGVASVAEHLALRVDSIITLPEELIKTAFVKAVSWDPEHATQTATIANAPETIKAAKISTESQLMRPKPGAPKPPTPALLNQRPKFQSPVKATASTAPADYQLVYSSTQQTSGFAGAAGTGDPSAMDVATEVGSSVARNWHASTSQAELKDLLADRPLLPAEIDRVLLKDCAQRIGEWRTDLQDIRRAMRVAFWEQLDQLT